MSQNHPPLIVLGTVNLDHSVTVERHPRPGETVLGDSHASGTGGKGANQAVAAAQAGVDVVLLSAVGDDSAGEELLVDLRRRGVDTSHIAHIPGLSSGTAFITVSRDGENAIVVAPGAGAAISLDFLTTTLASLVEPGAILLTQLELPVPVVASSCLAAHEAGARIVVNLSPSQEAPESLIGLADPLLVNESEEESLAGVPLDTRSDAIKAIHSLASRCRSVVITMGDRGALAFEDDSLMVLPAQAVRVVDTTGAGDSFAGALAAALLQGESLGNAVEHGIKASAGTVQHRGALPPLQPPPRSG